MTGVIRHSRIGGALAALTILASACPANAVVYCKRVGYPKGCVAAAPVHRPVVYCKRVGYPKGCVAR
ncbi:MAG TPA: hypothetical protein VJY34_16605 [Roseiarcus sp.]|nr:hypothetical protein [Roseiarcus sp.]